MRQREHRIVQEVLLFCDQIRHELAYLLGDVLALDKTLSCLGLYTEDRILVLLVLLYFPYFQQTMLPFDTVFHRLIDVRVR